ncbi:MAG TPA: hypothetical protein ENN29_07645, partial [Candidatus Hydrogenedentes bacterium]|nr:hypothetical protein [Candidatus Hydrogenedentota bacterium]
MIPEILEKILQTWRNLSEREQRLAVLTVIAATLMIVFFTFRRAQDRIDDLDREIDILEEQLVSFTGHLGHRDFIEAQYAAIAAQHSSEWTEAEIHDRLRQEIYRLAKNDPPPLDERGIPIDVAARSGNLVEISMGKGQMTEGGVGYREYRINLRIQPTYLNNIIEFLQRLHNSPQSLRIDALDLNRAPESDMVAASVDISRIVADGAPMPQGAATVASSSGVGRIPLRADSWEAFGATIQDDESASLRAHGAVT